MRTCYHPIAVFISLFLVNVAANAQPVDDDVRGLKSKVLEQPQYSEPKYQEPGPDVLEEKLLPKVQKPSSKSLSQIVHRFVLKQLVLVDNTILSEAEINGVVSKYINKPVSIEDLHQIRYQLSLLLFKKGFISSGFLLPDQKIEGGVVRLQAVNGMLENIQLTGNDDLRDSYIKKRIKPKQGEQLNVKDLQLSLKKLQRNELIKKLNAKLSPGETDNGSILDLFVQENESRSISLIVDNHRPVSIGAEAGTMLYKDRNLFGVADSLSIGVTSSEGLDAYEFAYSIPVSAADTRIYFSYQNNDAEVVEEPFDTLNISSEFTASKIGISHPFINQLNSVFSSSLNLVVKESETFLFGEPFSFAEGAQQGTTKTAVVELGVDWTLRNASRVINTALTLRKGLDALDSTVDGDSMTGSGDDYASAEFTSLLAQFQYARKLSWISGSQYLFRIAAQESQDPLLSLEKFALGGSGSVRGYRENRLVRDNGIASTLELRLPLAGAKNGVPRYGLQFATFFDWGKAWDERTASNDGVKDEITSAGVALLWNPSREFSMNITWADALDDDFVVDGDDLQDDGLHFSFSYSVYF